MKLKSDLNLNSYYSSTKPKKIMQYKVKSWSPEHSKHARVIRACGLSLFAHWLPGGGLEFDYVTIVSDKFKFKFSTPLAAKRFLKEQNYI